MPSNTHQNNITCQACSLIRPVNTSISNRDAKQARQFTRTTRRRWCSSQVPPPVAWAAGGLSKTVSPLKSHACFPANTSKINVMNKIAPAPSPSSAFFLFPRPSLYSAGRLLMGLWTPGGDQPPVYAAATTSASRHLHLIRFIGVGRRRKIYAIHAYATCKGKRRRGRSLKRGGEAERDRLDLRPACLSEQGLSSRRTTNNEGRRFLPSLLHLHTPYTQVSIQRGIAFGPIYVDADSPRDAELHAGFLPPSKGSLEVH